MNFLPCLVLLCQVLAVVRCWTDEDLELFDLVESTDRKFYDVLGVDQKASASDIRKAYRRLSQLYHPDKNKEPDAEETFRKIAAIADVLRNEEQRKKYDIILQTGLPDWREPIYYYRRVRNMGLLELLIFLFCLVTLGQYLFAWSAYWEKKYEIEELILSKMKKKTAKQLRKNKATKSVDEAAIAAEIDNIPKPRYQDLFPVQLFYLMIHLVQSLPSFMKCAYENSKAIFTSRSKDDNDSDLEEEEENSERRTRQKCKKHLKPHFPDLTATNGGVEVKLSNGFSLHNSKCDTNGEKPSTNTRADVHEFQKALKKFPNGTLQRWEKIAEHLNWSVSEVVAVAKKMKSQPYAKSVDISAQGVTGSEFNGNCVDVSDISERSQYREVDQFTQKDNLTHRMVVTSPPENLPDKVWTQDEQRLLEQALIKFPKDTLARWDCISNFVASKTKEECITRYKELAQQIKRKRGKEN